MKFKSIIFILAIAIGILSYNLVVDSSNSTFQPRETYTTDQGPAGHFEYLHMLNADPVTGEVDYAAKMQVREHLIKKGNSGNDRSSSALQWVELGPDNIAGRVHAIDSDDNNPALMYTGGTTGGLWKTEDGGLSWGNE